MSWLGRPTIFKSLDVPGSRRSIRSHLLIGLFVVVYLVRVWSYVVRGRLPGPGIL